jgi:predicted  nucleic acid-binding Zn-ribbon protein
MSLNNEQFGVPVGEAVTVSRWDAMEALHQEIQLLKDRVNRLVESRAQMAQLVTEGDKNYAALNERLRVSAKVVAEQQEEIERLRLREALR